MSSPSSSKLLLISLLSSKERFAAAATGSGVPEEAVGTFWTADDGDEQELERPLSLSSKERFPAAAEGSGGSEKTAGTFWTTDDGANDERMLEGRLDPALSIAATNEIY